LSFEKLEGDKWAFNSSVIGAEVIVKSEPEQTKRIIVRLSNFDRPFTCGNCRVLSSGWTEQDGQYVQIWGYKEFAVEQELTAETVI